MFKFRPQKFREGFITLWLDSKELPRLRAVLLYHKFCGKSSIPTEAFFDGLIRPRCYVKSMYKRAVKTSRNKDKGQKVKKVWGIFATRMDAMKYLFLCCIKGYLKWIEIENRSRVLKRNIRSISLTDYGKIKQRDFLEELNQLSLEDLDSEANYPLYIIKKCFLLDAEASENVEK